MIYFGKVIKFFPNGYGFIEGFPFSYKCSKHQTFLHISHVQDFELKNKLTKSDINDCWMWYTIEITSKGRSVKTTWKSFKEVSNEFVEPLLGTMPFTSAKYGDKLSLSFAEAYEIMHYIEMFMKNNFGKQEELNNYLSYNNLWDSFRLIRSINEHGPNKKVKGIWPAYYAITSRILKLHGSGDPLTSSQRY